MFSILYFASLTYLLLFSRGDSTISDGHHGALIFVLFGPWRLFRKYIYPRFWSNAMASGCFYMTFAVVVRIIILLQFGSNIYGDVAYFWYFQRERLLMLPWMFFSLMTIVWIGFDLVMDQMYGKITTESFYFNMAIGNFHWIILVWTEFRIDN